MRGTGRSGAAAKAKAKAKKRPTPRREHLSQMNLQYKGIDYEVDSDRSNCQCDMICRCATISATITDVSARGIARAMDDKDKGSLTDTYGIERIVAMQDLRADDFDVQIGGGYYGEEVYGVRMSFEKAERIESKVSEYKALPDDPSVRVPWLLVEENGFLLESLEDRKYEARVVPIDAVKEGNKDHYQRLDRRAVDQYAVEIGFQQPKDSKVPLGVAIDDGNGVYRVVDGYHRLAAARAAGLDKITIWAAVKDD